MKILAVDHSVLDPLGRSLYRILSEQFHLEIRLLTPSRWFNNYQLLSQVEPQTSVNLPVFPSKMFLPSRTHRMVYLDLPGHVHTFKPDLLYVNSEPENYQTCHAAYTLRHSQNTKLVFSTWRNIDHRAIGYPYKMGFLNDIAERYVLAHADHGVAFNEKAGSIFRELGYPKITMIPPDLDITVFRRRERRELREKYGLRKFTVGFAGRLANQKGIPDLFRASALLAFEYQILIVGVGPMRDRLVALSKELKIADRIVWMHPVRRYDMPPILSAMDVLVLPSRTGRLWKEQFGRTGDCRTGRPDDETRVDQRMSEVAAGPRR